MMIQRCGNNFSETFTYVEKTKRITYSTAKGLGFSVDFNSKLNAVQKMELFNKEILFNEINKNRIYIINHNEDGGIDTIVYSPNLK